jgi:hypothetical protein
MTVELIERATLMADHIRDARIHFFRLYGSDMLPGGDTGEHAQETLLRDLCAELERLSKENERRKRLQPRMDGSPVTQAACNALVAQRDKAWAETEHLTAELEQAWDLAAVHESNARAMLDRIERLEGDATTPPDALREGWGVSTTGDLIHEVTGVRVHLLPASRRWRIRYEGGATYPTSEAAMDAVERRWADTTLCAAQRCDRQPHVFSRYCTMHIKDGTAADGG